MAKEETNTKFRVKADLALFEALQKDGRLSEEKIARMTNIPSTTVHYALERIRRRNFFHIKAVPVLEKFREIPMAVIGFADVHPVRLYGLQKSHAGMPEVLQFLHDEKDAVLLVADRSMESLTKTLFRIMKQLDEKPCLYMKLPRIVRNQVTIPDRILEAVYGDLPDRRIKV